MPVSKLKIIFLSVSLMAVASCASWHHQSDFTTSTDDSALSNVETRGLNDEPLTNNDVLTDDNAADETTQNKLTYYFDFNKSVVRQADEASIAEDAQYLIDHPNLKALIEGHTDPRGSREYNIALGERRAKTIAAKLIAQGVSATRIRTISYGAEKLATSGHAAVDYQLDRRGVIIYLSR